MAYNPPLTNEGLPCKVDGELFVLQRKDMEIEVKIDGNKQWGKKTGRGIMFLTSCRIVFVSDKWRTNEFKAFDIPLTNMKKESFEQPVFGSNYLKGNVLPLFNLIPGEAQFKLWFRSGGCGTFLKMCDSVLKQVRRNRNSNRQGPDQRFMADVQNGNIKNQSALFDPNDPSTIYISQPPVPQQNPEQMQNFYGNFHGNNPYYVDNNLSNNNQFNQPQQQQPQFNQQNNYNQPPQQQQPQPFQQGDTFQQYNPNNYQQQQQPQQNYNQQAQINQIPSGLPPQQGQQYQPYQQGDSFQQYNPQQQQYQNNPNNPQNYQFNQQQLDQQQQLNAPPQINQPQQKQYFGFFGPNLQQNQQPLQQDQNNNQFQNQPNQQNQNQNQQNQNNPSNNYPQF